SALSHGQRKRVSIAAVLALEPEVLLLDEPTAGQDHAHYSEFMEFLRGVHRAGTTVVLITTTCTSRWSTPGGCSSCPAGTCWPTTIPPRCSPIRSSPPARTS